MKPDGHHYQLLKKSQYHEGSVVSHGSKSVAVAEDWYPTIDGLVTVTVSLRRDGTGRVSVWGGDDTGLEIGYTGGPPLAAERARRLFDRINHLVTMDDLISWGFRSC